MIGQSDILETNEAIKHWKAEGLDFKNLFFKPESWEGEDNFNSKGQDHNIYEILDREFIDKAQEAINNQKPIQIQSNIKNTDRSTGTMLSHEVAKKYGHAGLEQDTINIQLKGTAGQSFGAFLAKGITLDLEGEANDYVGKGLSGGRIAIRPSLESSIIPEESMIVGNTVLYGAIEGECYFRGIAGERFAVRNSGATAIVEGAGDHCCEYMTGGIVVVIGDVGRNFGAGMSGGIAYVLDKEDRLKDLIDQGIWTDKDELEISRQKMFIEQLQNNKTQLVLKSQIDKQNKSIKETREKINQLEFAMAGYDKVRPMADLNASKNYDLYHKDFSSAMQHAYKMAKKLHGITIDPKEIDSKVATGPRKPGNGKTNKYSLKGDKGTIQIQVYNKGGSKPFELNMYKS